MGSTILLFAIDLSTDTTPWGSAEAPAGARSDIRLCRAIDCGRLAHGSDEFCPRCREEVDALRAMPPWRPRRRRS